MATSTDINEKISKKAADARSRLISDEERAAARLHVARRDSTASKLIKERPIVNRRSGWMRGVIAVVIAVVGISGLVLGGTFLYIRALETTNQQARRELQGYADKLNQSLPDYNKVKVEKVENVNGQLVASVTQGNTRCTLSVNEPDSGHNLYWIAGIDAVKISDADRTLFKCVESKGFSGLGAKGNS